MMILVLLDVYINKLTSTPFVDHKRRFVNIKKEYYEIANYKNRLSEVKVLEKRA